jgi:hypothetical protein
MRLGQDWLKCRLGRKNPVELERTHRSRGGRKSCRLS